MGWGYSLYDAPSGRKADRSRAVSFDRPYQAVDRQGAGDFLFFELPLLRFAEQAGLPLGYATDVDLHADPHLADAAAAIVTLGHDEYWSTAMRRNVTAARNRGVNLAFLGGNEIYRHIRFEPTTLVPTPRPIEVLFHSPLTCGGRSDFADTSYYTTPSGAAVFAAGTQYWICALGPGCAAGRDDTTAHRAITAISLRLLRAYAAGPAGRTHPAHDNLAALAVPGGAPNLLPTLPPDNSTTP